MESVTLEEFKTILIHLLTVALSETDGWVDTDNANKTHSEKGREFLIRLIKDSRKNDANEEFHWSNKTEYENEKNEEVEETEQSNNQLDIFLEDILDKSKVNSKQSGNRISAYYLPELANDIMRLCKDFPLWTSVMKTHFNSPYDIPTSASIEGDFKELKCTILRHNLTYDCR